MTDYTKTAIIHPTVHLNGSGRQHLLAQYTVSAADLCKALESLRESAPNARDYYTQDDPLAFKRALEQHTNRLHRIESVIDELRELAQHVADAPSRL